MESSNTPALEVSGVFKTYEAKGGKKIEANKNVNLRIDEGKIYGLLGPNGAGKSTLIHIISGVIRPDAGTVNVFGKDILTDTDDAKKMMGVVPQETVYEMAFTVREVLYYFSGMYGLPMSEREARIDEILDALDLTDKKNERARNLSGGQKRRLMVAKSILHHPKFVILDEPTAGVDVALRQKVWQLVRKLNEEGTTILFTTHYLEEAEQLCESITLIDHGEVIQQGKLSEIQKEFTENVIIFELFDQKIQHLDGVKTVGVEFQYPVRDLDEDMQKVIRHYGDNLRSIKSAAPSLEQIFLQLTK